MKVIYLLRYILCVVLCLAPVQQALADVSVLTQVPDKRSHVGIIPYYKHNNSLYVLLGRESVDVKSSKSAGRFADFGGGTELDGTTLAQNVVRELNEETMGKISLPASDVISKGDVLHTASDSGATKYYYVFYPLSEQDFLQSKTFNQYRQELSTKNMDPHYLEKDQFYWFRLDEVAKQSSTLHDIDGKLHTIKFRDHFARYCLQHPLLSELVANLK